MKRSLSFIITLVFILSAMCSCAAPWASSLSSSAQSDRCRAWLAARIGDVSDIIIGTEEDARAYNVSLDGFDDDGFIIRRIDAGTAIFAKTDAGLDRAVREYVKHAGEGDYEYVYGDGQPRVGKIILAGYDIADYVILIPEDAASDVKFAAQNIRDYTKNACGTELTITSERGKHNIEFILDDTVHEQGFVIETIEGKMQFSCKRSCKKRFIHYN